MNRRRRKEKAQEKSGGLAYYLSLISLLILSFSNIIALSSRLSLLPEGTLLNFTFLAPSLVAGFLLVRLLVPERILTLMHELRHAVLSGLAGNKWKVMNINRASGSFEYSYTRGTAHMNALISLAPYFLPLLTIPAVLAAWALFRHSHQNMVMIISFVFGGDLYMSVRDISPHQSDFSELRGGFGLGLLYVIAANIFLVTTLAAWALWGQAGLLLLMNTFWDMVGVGISAIRR